MIGANDFEICPELFGQRQRIGRVMLHASIPSETNNGDLPSQFALASLSTCNPS